jgi:hypothetical protein
MFPVRYALLMHPADVAEFMIRYLSFKFKRLFLCFGRNTLPKSDMALQLTKTMLFFHS